MTKIDVESVGGTTIKQQKKLVYWFSTRENPFYSSSAPENCQNFWGGILLACGGWRPWMLQNILLFIEQSPLFPTENYLAPKSIGS